VHCVAPDVDQVPAKHKVSAVVEQEYPARHVAHEAEDAAAVHVPGSQIVQGNCPDVPL
jgi:hypothetical protein